MSKTQPPPAPDMGTIRLEEIRTDGGTQCRVVTDEEVINEYVEALKAGRIFPPVTVFSDMYGVFWLADGHHRYAAHQRAGFNHIQAHIHRGSQRDAQLYSIGANAENGLRRSNLDKRNAVLKLLRDEEWSRLPVRRMAEIARVSDAMIVKVRQELNSGRLDPEGRKLIPAPSASLATYADCDAAALEHAVEQCADPLTLAALLSAPALTAEQKNKLTAARASLEALYSAKPGAAWAKAALAMIKSRDPSHPTRGMTQGARAALQATRRKWATRQGERHEIPTMQEARETYSQTLDCLHALEWAGLDDDAVAALVIVWENAADFERAIRSATANTLWGVQRFAEGSESGKMPALKARAERALVELRAKMAEAPAEPAKPNPHTLAAEIIGAPDYPQRIEREADVELLKLLMDKAWQHPDRYAAPPPERARALRPLIRARLVALGVPIQTCPDPRCGGAETIAAAPGAAETRCDRCYNVPTRARQRLAEDISKAMSLLRLVGSRPEMSVLRGAASHPAGIVAGMQAAPADAVREAAEWLLQIEVSDVG